MSRAAWGDTAKKLHNMALASFGLFRVSIGDVPLKLLKLPGGLLLG